MKKLVIALCATAALVACKPVETNNLGKYYNATFVVNEGPFGTGSGSLDAWVDDSVRHESIYQFENAQPLGNVVQSMLATDSSLFLMVNNSNAVVGIDRGSAVELFRTPVSSPRYAVEHNGLLYVSTWTNSIQVLNSITGALVDSIDVGGSTEGLCINDGSLFVARNGGFAVDSAVVVVDLQTYATETFTVADKPNSFAVANGDVYVLCSGYESWSALPSTEAALYKWNGNSFELSASAGDPDVHAIDLVALDNALFCLNAGYNGKLVQFDLSTALWPTTELNAQPYYRLSSTGGNLYGTDAADFASAGMVFKMNSAGELQDSLAAGVIPNSVVRP